MTAVEMMRVCQGCGAEVVMVPMRAGPEPTVSSPVWGVPVAFERVMSRAGGALRLVQHLCRDYIDWHRRVPDRCDPHAVDVPDGWRPRPAPVVSEAA